MVTDGHCQAEEKPPPMDMVKDLYVRITPFLILGFPALYGSCISSPGVR